MAITLPVVSPRDYFTQSAKSPRHFRIIGGYPFESVVIKWRLYNVPFLCDSCADIKETLLDNGSFAFDNGEDLRRSLIDPILSPWELNQHTNSFFTKGFETRFTSTRKICKTISQPVVLKYCHKNSNPYANMARGSCESDVKSQKEPKDEFLVDEEAFNTRQGGNWDGWEKLDQENKMASGSYLHSTDHLVHISNYRLKKYENMKTVPANKATPLLPYIRLPKAFQPGFEFWETFDLASTKKESALKLGKGYRSDISTAHKKQMKNGNSLNMTILDTFRKEQQLIRKREEFEKKKPPNGGNLFKGYSLQTRNSVPCLYPQCISGGHLTPSRSSHFMENLNNLRVDANYMQNKWLLKSRHSKPIHFSNYDE